MLRRRLGYWIEMTRQGRKASNDLWEIGFVTGFQRRDMLWCVSHSDWEEYIRVRREQYHDRQQQFKCFERIAETEG